MATDNATAKIFVLCDTAVISKENKLSIIGIFDQIVSDKIPFNFPRMNLVGVVSGKPQSEHSLSLNINDPSGKELSSVNIKVTLGPSGSSNIISEMTNFPISTAGSHTISLLEDKKSLASINLIVGKSVTKPAVSA